MKIMVQNRSMILEQPRQVWVSQKAADDGEKNGIVMSNVRCAPVLGEYKSVNRAKEVLSEMFEFQRIGKHNYYMPKD